jgi:pterin-4a-carbinolamine dehydratase
MNLPSNLAQNVISDICYTLGMPKIPVYKSDVANACAFTDNEGNRFITYNSNFLNYLSANNQWAPISVLAHEVGHHYEMHTSWYGTFLHPWTRELQSDYISGYVLYKLGCPTIHDALSAMNLMFTYTGSASHPDSPKRMDALNQGYFRASQGF